MSALVVCNCCGKKTLNPLFCCAKKQFCRECYQEVCTECLGTIEMCHKCYIRGRPDAASVEALKQLEGEELERIVKTLHLDPSKKSENEWITLIATHCGLPLKLTRPLGPKRSNSSRDSTPKMDSLRSNGKVKKSASVKKFASVKKTASVKTHAISSVADPLKNRSSLHGQIVHEISREDSHKLYDDQHMTHYEADDEVDEGIQADNSPKHTLSKTSPLSSPDSDSDDDNWPHPSSPPPTEMTINRFKSPLKPNTYTQPEVQSSENLRTPSWLNKNISNPPRNNEPKDEEITEVDAKILRNIQQRRQLTPDEQRSLANFESKLQSWKTKGQVQSPTSNGPKASAWKAIDETPIVNSIRDIISKMNKGDGQSEVRRPSIEIIQNNEEKTVIEINPSPSFNKTNKPEVRKNPPENVLIFDKTQDRPKTVFPEVHQSRDNWSKIALRDTNQPKPWMTEAMNRQLIKSAPDLSSKSDQILNASKLEIKQLPDRQDSNLTGTTSGQESMATRNSNLAKLLMLDAAFDQKNSNQTQIFANVHRANRRDSNQVSKSTTEMAKPATETSIFANVHGANRRDSNQTSKSTTEIAKPTTETQNFANVFGFNRRDSNQISKSTTEVTKPGTETQNFANVFGFSRRDSNQIPKSTTEIAKPKTEIVVVANVHAPHRRDSNQIKPSSINIVNKLPINNIKPASIAIKNETLNEQSANVLLSSVANEKAIERMDILQMRKILRQLNVKSQTETLFKREEMVEELQRLYRKAQDKNNVDLGKPEVVIIVNNRPKTTTTGGGARVTSLKTIEDEEQIRKLNIFQLKALLMDTGSEVANVNSKHELVEIAIEKWKTLRN